MGKSKRPNVNLPTLDKFTCKGRMSTPTSSRRLRSDDSSPDPATPAKKQDIRFSPDNDSDFAQLLDPKYPDSAPSYALKLMEMQTQTQESVSRMETKLNCLEKTVSILTDSINYISKDAQEALAKATAAEANMNELCVQINTLCNDMKKLSAENRALNERVNQQEAYSRRNNLIISGLPEEPREGNVVHKIHHVMATMGHPNPQAVPIIKAHRLGSFRRTGPGVPRPRDVIVRFERLGDRDEMMRFKHYLKGTNLIINEDLPAEMQETREMLKPILQAAKKMPEYRDTKLVQDKLVVKNRSYTTKNLKDLPPQLHPTKISSRENNETFVWFSRLSPLSNFAPYPINIDGKIYSCNEQFIQSKKAEMARDEQAKMNEGTWAGQLKGILKTCNWAKYTQHDEPLAYLLSTGEKTLGEAKAKGPAGIGLPLHHRDVLNRNLWHNQNLMGHCLMEIRQQKK